MAISNDVARYRHDVLLREYIDLVEYMNGAEFHTLSTNKQNVLANQRFGMEQYLNALNTYLYVDVDKMPQGSVPNVAGMFAAMSMLQPPKFQQAPPPPTSETQQVLDTYEDLPM